MNVTTSLSDTELIAGISAGRLELFTVIYERYRNNLYVQALAFLKDAAAAKDLVQETFLKALSSIKAGLYRNTGMLVNWLYTIAKNLFINQYHRAAKMPMSGDSDRVFDETIGHDFIHREGPENLSIKKEMVASLKAFVGTLPEKYSQIMNLYLYEELKYREIAELLNLDINTVKTRIRTAKRFLNIKMHAFYALPA